MSKRKFVLFALVAALVLGFAGSAFATNIAWKGNVTAGTIDAGGNYVGDAAPDGTAGDMISIGGADTTINVTDDFTVGAIHVNATGTVTFNIATGEILTITSDNADADAPGGLSYGISVESGNVVFTGGGSVRFSNNAAGAFRIYVADTNSVTFQTLVDSDGDANALHKYDRGTVAFEGANDNAFSAASAIFTVHDGVLAISRTGHINANTRIVLDGTGITDANPTLATTWETADGTVDVFDAQSNANPKVSLTTDATIDVRGAALTFGRAANAPAALLAVGANELTKTGPGNLVVTSDGTNANDVVTADADGVIVIEEGHLVLAADDVNHADLSVTVNDGTQLVLRRDVANTITSLTGTENGAVSLAEGAVLTVGNGTDYPGLITGWGNLVIAGNSTISGIRNDYRGDTTVNAQTRLTINHANNLGGTNTGRLFLTAGNVAAGATLRIADDSNFILPNIVILTVPAAGTGSVTVNVPAGAEFEFASDIDYNQNFINKIGGGTLVLSGIGANSIGTGAFTQGTNAPLIGTLALLINDGKVRLDNNLSTHFGDIDLPDATANTRPVLSVRNGVVLRSAIRFGNLTTFETEILPENFGRGGEVPSAVDVRALVTSTGGNARVFNRINFLALPTGGVQKYDTVQILGASPFENYEASNVWPIEQDTQTKAPFDPFVSTLYLYFEATHNIDVPVFGTPSVTTAAPGANYRIVIPVTTTTNLRGGTLGFAGLAEATAVLEGSNIVITGTAPELPEGTEELTRRYTVNVTSGSLGDTLGYVNTADFELTVTEGGGPVQPIPGPAWTWTRSFDTDVDVLSGTVTLAVDGDPVGADVPAVVSVYEGSDFVQSADVTLAAATGATTFTLAADYKYATAYTLRVVTGNANYDGVATASSAITSPAAPVTPGRAGSGGGCDAGFGLFGLLAATGAVALLRRKG